jgi:hypothetical protein
VSRYKFDRSREFIPGYKVGGGHLRSVAVQTNSEPEICQGTGFKLRADERVRVQQPLQICLDCRSKSKKCDKQLTHIVRVRHRAFNHCFKIRFKSNRATMEYKKVAYNHANQTKKRKKYELLVPVIWILEYKILIHVLTCVIQVEVIQT